MSSQHDYDTLWALMRDVKFCMLTHKHPEGMLHSHPMTLQNTKYDEGSTLYFFIPRSGELFTRLHSDPNVNLSYSDIQEDVYVSICGRASFPADPAQVQEMWSPLNKAWFPGGPSDPDLSLLAIEIEEAEYWQVKEGKATQLFKMAKAAVTGHPPVDMGEHRTIGATPPTPAVVDNL